MLMFLKKPWFQPQRLPRIVMAQFLTSDSVPDRHLAATLKTSVEQAARALAVPVEVKLVSARLLPNDHANAERLGRQHQADVIVWGSDTGEYTSFSLLNLKAPMEQAHPILPVSCSPETGVVVIAPDAENTFGTPYFLQHLEFIATLTLGHLYNVQSDYSQGIQVLAKAMASISPDLPPIDGLAQTYFRLGWIYQTRFENAPIALRYYNRALDLAPAMAVAYNNRGVLRLTSNDPVGALTDLDQALRLNPRLMGALMGRGALYNQLQKLELAIADYDAFLTQAPQSIFNIAAYFGRGSAYARLGQYESAVADFEKALSLDPDDAIKAALLYSLANCLKNKALQERLTPDEARALLRDDPLPEPTPQEDDLTQAIRHFQSSMALFEDEDDRGNALVEIAAIYGEQGDPLRAIELLDLALLRLRGFYNRQRASHLRQQMALTLPEQGQAA